MNKFVIGALSVVASVAMAQESTMESTTTMDSPIKVFANVDLNVTKIDAGEGDDPDTGLGLTAGADGVYLFTNEMGASLGLDFNMISGKYDDTDNKQTVTYLDVPVNFVYNWADLGGIGVLVGLGPYVGIPIGDIKNSKGDDQDAKTAFGANLETHVTWELSPEFALGGHLGFKYEFSDLVDNDTAPGTQKYWAVGLGIGAKFL